MAVSIGVTRTLTYGFGQPTSMKNALSWLVHIGECPSHDIDPSIVRLWYAAETNDRLPMPRDAWLELGEIFRLHYSGFGMFGGSSSASNCLAAKRATTTLSWKQLVRFRVPGSQ